MSELFNWLERAAERKVSGSIICVCVCVCVCDVDGRAVTTFLEKNRKSDNGEI